LTSNLLVQTDDPYAIDLNRYSRRGLLDRALAKLNPEKAVFRQVSMNISSAIIELVRKHKLDIFETEESFGWSLATSKLKLLPVVVRLHGPWALYGRFSDPRNRTITNLRRVEREGSAIEGATLVSANCADTLNAVRRHYGLDLENNCIIPTPNGAAAEAKWSVKTTNPNKILFVGRFDTLKGGDFILRSFFKLADGNPELRLTFVGPDIGIEGPTGETCFFEEFVKTNFPDWFRSRIDFRGQMNHAEVMALREDHFVTVAAAQVDTMGYMLLEPMSLGCPLVTTAVGGIPEFIKDRHNGLLVPSQDISAMVSAVQSLLNDHNLASNIGQQAWLDCKNLYSPDIVAKQSLAAYDRAISVFKGRHKT
jgi:glycosyltransferase involved in cell wall biosynthesis